MKKRLHKIEFKKVEELVQDRALLESLDPNETFYQVTNSSATEEHSSDPLVQVEVALNRCERVGFFRS